ncbi:hypothetical protein BX600DRAFT_432011 [Xylariales sp. PMI_506]|nr:hypothetical protein BX600DRAFT_432011 [Xylariales sp. PMI_506]
MVRLTLTTFFASCLALAAARNCRNITVPLTLNATNAVFSIKTPQTNLEVEDLVWNIAIGSAGYIGSILSHYETVSGSYKIAATYCEPKAGPGKALQILTHGVGFDRSYWDFPVNNYNYSYVNQALDRGYSTFFFDRLGLGESSHGDPLSEIQSSIEVVALYAMTSLLREGKLPGVNSKFSKLFHVGHSFGSIQTYGLTAKFPSASDGIALTGFSAAAEYIPYFLFGGNFIQANQIATLADYPNGYLAPSDPTAVQTNFFSPGSFDPAILEATYKAGQPVTVGEFLTLGAPTQSSNPFEGPVLVITGGESLDDGYKYELTV